MVTSPLVRPIPMTVPSLENLAEVGWTLELQVWMSSLVSMRQKLTCLLTESTAMKVKLSKEKSTEAAGLSCVSTVSKHQQFPPRSSTPSTTARTSQAGPFSLRINQIILWTTHLLQQTNSPYNHLTIFIMQGKRSDFLVQGRNLEILVLNADATLKIILILQESSTVGQQVYTDSNLLQLAGTSSFRNLQEFYQYLLSARANPDKWTAVDASSLQVAYQSYAIKLPLRPVIDPLDMSKVALSRASFRASSPESPQDLGALQQEVISLRSGYNSVGAKLKGIGELFEKLHKTTDEHTVMIGECNRKLNAHEDRLVELESGLRASDEAMYTLKSNIEILEKTMHRNNQTLRETMEKGFQDNKGQFERIWGQIEKYDFMRIKRDNQQILRLFELEIKVKDHAFVPDQALLKLNLKLHWLNKRTLKNLEDVKDYNKAVGELPFAPGISKMRIAVHSIKNNGLLLGVCSRKAKETLEATSFNDPTIISLNSCGYLTNRGSMIMTNAKVKKGDILKMQVNLSQGVVAWFCNDVEVGVADMGPLRKEEVFPVIGLGYFGDEIEVLESEPPKKQTDIVHDTYAKELERMNDKFGTRRRY